jgi:hypothetical protein
MSVRLHPFHAADRSRLIFADLALLRAGFCRFRPDQTPFHADPRRVRARSLSITADSRRILSDTRGCASNGCL